MPIGRPSRSTDGNAAAQSSTLGKIAEMNAPGTVILTFLAADLVGRIPFGYLIARSRGVDMLHEGSGNIGATNVGRILGWRFGILVFVLDFAKGAIPVAASAWIGTTAGADLPMASLEVTA